MRNICCGFFSILVSSPAVFPLESSCCAMLTAMFCRLSPLCVCVCVCETHNVQYARRCVNSVLVTVTKWISAIIWTYSGMMCGIPSPTHTLFGALTFEMNPAPLPFNQHLILKQLFKKWGLTWMSEGQGLKLKMALTNIDIQRLTHLQTNVQSL